METTEFLKEVVRNLKLLTRASVKLTLESDEFRVEAYLRTGEKAAVRLNPLQLDATLDPLKVAREIYGNILSAIFDSEKNKIPYTQTISQVYVCVTYLGYSAETGKAIIDVNGSHLEVSPVLLRRIDS